MNYDERLKQLVDLEQINRLQNEIKNSKNTEEAHSIFFKLKEEVINKVISEVLVTSKDIEVIIDGTLMNYFFGDDPKGSVFFRLILASGSISFMEKWKILRRLITEKRLEEIEGVSGNDFNEKVIRVRNKWAHGKLAHNTKMIALLHKDGEEIIDTETVRTELMNLNQIKKNLFEWVTKQQKGLAQPQ